MIPHCFKYVEVWSLGRIHHSIRPAATDFFLSFDIPKPFLAASLPVEWLSDSHPSVETISDEASVSSEWIN